MIRLNTAFGLRTVSILAVDDDDALAIACKAVKMRIEKLNLEDLVEISRADGSEMSGFSVKDLAGMAIEPR